MIGIVIILLLWSILNITSGNNVVEGVFFLSAFALSMCIGLWVRLDDAKRKKDGERCMRNWEEYKRKNRK